MEVEEQGLKLSTVLVNASVLKCAALALTATLFSSLLELFVQVAVFESNVIENGDKVVDAHHGKRDNDDRNNVRENDGNNVRENDGEEGEEEEVDADEKGSVGDADENGEVGDDVEPEGDDGNDDDKDEDHENYNDEDDEIGDEVEEEEEGEEAEVEEEEEEDEEEALQPPKKRKK